MKIFVTLCFLFFFHLIVYTQNVSRIDKVDCKEIQKKREYAEVFGQGTLLHLSCEDLTHIFFLLENRSDSSGILLNKKYTVRGKNLKVTSVGPDFFVVQKSGKDFRQYQYTFTTNSWSLSKIVSPPYSTGNREDP